MSRVDVFTYRAVGLPEFDILDHSQPFGEPCSRFLRLPSHQTGFIDYPIVHDKYLTAGTLIGISGQVLPVPPNLSIMVGILQKKAVSGDLRKTEFNMEAIILAIISREGQLRVNEVTLGDLNDKQIIHEPIDFAPYGIPFPGLTGNIYPFMLIFLKHRDTRKKKLTVPQAQIAF